MNDGAAARTAAPSACPPAETIAALVAGALDHEARARIDVHVSRCAECREVIAALASGEESEGEEAARSALEASEPAIRPLAELLATARLGEVVGEKWRLVRLLGTGGMGQVFEAENVHDGTRGALKLLRPELADHPEVARRFLRERYAANRIDHPAFVRVVDDGTTAGGAPYLVMELVVGDTLRKVVKNEGPLPEPRVRALGARILEAVAAAHAAGVLHRDLKPDNVALEPGGAVRILDFGIARVTDPGDGDGSTITGQMLGTPTYMPPEQARGLQAQVDERVDVFATAATLVFLLTGNAIRPATGALFEAMTQPVPPVRTLAPAVSAQLARVLDRALAFEKEDRYASATAMRAALLDEPTEDHARAAPIGAVSVAPPAGRPRRGRLVIALGCALVVVAGAATGAAYLRARRTVATSQAPASSSEPRATPEAPEAPAASVPAVSTSTASAPPSVAAAASASSRPGPRATPASGAGRLPRPAASIRPKPVDPLERRN